MTRIFLSAGEASGDYYASLLAEELRRRLPELHFFGCAGPRMRDAGVEPIIPSETLSVVGLIEVIGHVPRIYKEFRKLIQGVRERRPEIAILTDSPDFHLRVARKMVADQVPVVYLVAPQVWAWRKDRLPLMRRVITRLLCIFPFEEKFFTGNGIAATYIGHPMSNRVRPALSREQFFHKHGIPADRPLIAVLPGSRRGEAARHLPVLIETARRLQAERPVHLVLPASPTTGSSFFRERNAEPSIQVIEGESWDAIAHADLALAASGTVTIECALLGTPLVTYYRVKPLSWLLGKLLVRVPFFSMVNLIAERLVIPELMQDRFTPDNLTATASELLDSPPARAKMKAGLAEVTAKLSGPGDAIERAAGVVQELLEARLVAKR